MARILKIFIDKEWKNRGEQLYNRVLQGMCSLVANLEDDKRDLILDLAERYEWIGTNEYQGKITEVLNKVDKQKLKKCRRIIVFPIMRPDDEAKVKSGHAMVYMIRGVTPFLDDFEGIDIKEIVRYDELLTLKIESDDLVFLVDDFLGSGETVNETLIEVLKNRSISLDKLIIISVMIQKDSIDIIEGYGVDLYYSDSHTKGISDFYADDEVEDKINLMLEIEKLIKVERFFSLGYAQSEALVTMIRTPDNTFPVFWKDYKIGNKEFKAPFPRYIKK